MFNIDNYQTAGILAEIDTTDCEDKYFVELVEEAKLFRKIYPAVEKCLGNKDIFKMWLVTHDRQRYTLAIKPISGSFTEEQTEKLKNLYEPLQLYYMIGEYDYGYIREERVRHLWGSKADEALSGEYKHYGRPCLRGKALYYPKDGKLCYKTKEHGVLLMVDILSPYSKEK